MAHLSLSKPVALQEIEVDRNNNFVHPKIAVIILKFE